MKTIKNKKENLFHKISISLSADSFKKLEELNVANKSAFINWLLEQHYNIISKIN